MTKCKKFIFSFIGLYVFAALSLAHAQGAFVNNGPSHKEHSGEHIQEIFNQLNLTDDQKKQLESNKQDHRAKMQNAHQAMKAAREEIHAELMKTQLDMSKINAIHGQIKVLQSQMEDIKLNSILTVRSILMPDQFSKFISLMHKYKQEHDDRE